MTSILLAPIRSRTVSRPVRVGLRPTPWRRTSRAGDDRRGDDEEGGRGEVGGDDDAARLEALGGVDDDGVALAAHFGAGGGEHALGVVAGRQRLDHAGLARGEERGEEQAGLDLGARHRQLVGDAVERRALDLERRQALLAGAQPRSHQAERHGDAVDRAPADRLVAVERPGPLRLPGEPARQQAQQRPRVADVDRRRARAAQPDPGDPQARRAEPVALADRVCRQLVADQPRPDRLHGGERRAGVGGVEVADDLGLPLAHRGDHRRAVGDRLVGGRAEDAAQGAEGVEVGGSVSSVAGGKLPSGADDASRRGRARGPERRRARPGRARRPRSRRRRRSCPGPGRAPCPRC